MKHCSKCNSLVPDDALRCIRCGFEVQSAAGAPAGNPTGNDEVRRSFWGWPSWWAALLLALLLLALESGVVAAKPALGMPFVGLYVLVVLVALAALIAGVRRIRSRARAVVWGALASIVQVTLFLTIAMAIGIREQAPIVYKSPGLRFVSERCKQDALQVDAVPPVPPGSPAVPTGSGDSSGSRKDALAVAWNPENTLKIDTTIVEGCSRRPYQGDYVLKGSTITLSYRTLVPDGAELACSCAFHVSYEIFNIPRAEYVVVLSTGKHGAD